MNAQDEDRIEKILNLCENRFLFLSSLKKLLIRKFYIDEILRDRKKFFILYKNVRKLLW